MAEETPRLYLTDVQLKGYKSIKDTKATFNEGINIIIGPNGSGKTNFLEYLEESFHNFASDSLFEGQNDFKYTILWEGGEAKVVRKFNFCLALDAPSIKGGIDINEKAKFEVRKGIVKVNRNNIIDIESKYYSDIDILQHEVIDAVIDAYHKLGDVPYMFLFYRSLVGYAIKSIKFEIDESFKNLANPLSLSFRLVEGRYFLVSNSAKSNVLFDYIKNSTDRQYYIEPEDLSKIKEIMVQRFQQFYQDRYAENISAYTPIEGVRISPKMYDRNILPDDIEISFVLCEFLINGYWYLWNQLSDGTRRVFSVVMSIIDAEDKIILLEEPELGLYPDQLQKLLTFIKEQSSRLQFIITTHSPDVMDILGIDELDRINICEMKGDEGTKIRKMNAKEKKGAETYYKNTGFLSDYWKHQNLGMK